MVNDDFEWEVLDCDSVRIYKEECRYKGEYCNAIIQHYTDMWEVEVDNLIHEPLYICAERKSKRSARGLAERIIRNDKDGDWQKNLKYV